MRVEILYVTPVIVHIVSMVRGGEGREPRRTASEFLKDCRN